MIRLFGRQLFLYALLAFAPFILARHAVAEETQALLDKLFAPDRLVDVKIELKREDWDAVRQETRSLLDALQNKGPAESPFNYVQGDVTIDGKRIPNVGIRKKGFLGSLDDERPSLKIKFDKYVEQAPFGNLNRLTLNNNKQDGSRLSQYLSYKLFNESGTVAPRCNFAKVTVNGKYLGVYSNVESMAGPLLERGYGDDSGMLFEGTVADLLSESVHKFEPKNKRAELTKLREVTAILAEEQLDLAKLDATLDIEAFIKFWAMESLIGFWDGYTHNQNNFFLYQNPKDSKHYFMPWGADSAFTYTVPAQIDRIQFRSFHSQSVLANRLYHIASTRAQYRKTLDKFLQTHWDVEKLLAEVDRVQALLRDEIRDDDTEFEKEVARVRKFIQGRRRALELELKRWPIPLRVGPRQPGFAKQIGHGQATFKTAWFARTPNNPEMQGDAELELTVNGEAIVFRQVGATAEPSKELSFGARKGPTPPAIVLTGIRESDGVRFTLAMGLDKSSFHPREKPAGMIGVLIEGNILAFVAQMIFNPSSITLIDAQATFTEASMKPGEPVHGKMKFRVMKFAGGKAPKVTWRPD